MLFYFAQLGGGDFYVSDRFHIAWHFMMTIDLNCMIYLYLWVCVGSGQIFTLYLYK